MPSYLITGASRGIGLEYVRQLSAVPGNRVFALVRNRQTATQVTSLSAPNVDIVEADISDLKALKTAASEVSALTGGSLDYVINNAAMIMSEGAFFPLDKYPEDLLEKEFHEFLQVNVLGVIHSINAFLPLLRNGIAEKVISLSSALGDIKHTLKLADPRIPALAGYSMSKAALNVVVAKYAVAHKAEGIMFLGIEPGFTDTSAAFRNAEQDAHYHDLEGVLKSLLPGFKGALTPEESVRLQLQVIHKATLQESGQFMSRHGDRNWL